MANENVTVVGEEHDILDLLQHNPQKEGCAATLVA